LLGAEFGQLFRRELGGAGMSLLASAPEATPPPPDRSVEGLRAALLADVFARPAARALWPELELDDLLVTPLSAGGERLGLLCAAARPDLGFDAEDVEMARAVAHLAAVAIKRADLIEGLTNASIIKDLFEALAAGATAFAAAKAAEVRCELTAPYLLVWARPAGTREQSSGAWRSDAEALGHELAELSPRCAIEAGPGPVRALLSLGPTPDRTAATILRECRTLGQRYAAVIGVSEPRRVPDDAAGAYREARDAGTIAQALLGEGGAIAYSQVGAYRYLVQIAAADAPRDRMQAAVDELIAYDRRRRTALLDTLERYLSERRSVIESARALFIHPNTLRQRLGRIEELTGLRLDEDDLLSLELAIKLARLHGRP
ncbi:MAG: helix-turn-helix domain-containing protein, partial [Solirubrobacteraceae bacterium]